MKKKILVTNLLVVLLILVLTGCNNQNKSEKQVETVLINTESEEKFDLETLRSEILLNGNKVTLPCTIEDLGEDYYYYEESLRKIGDEGELPQYRITMKSKKADGSNHINVYFNQYSEGDDLQSARIDGMSMILDTNQNDMRISNIGMNSSKEDVLEAFGQPTHIYGESDNIIFSYEQEDYGLMDFKIDDEKVGYIIIIVEINEGGL